MAAKKKHHKKGRRKSGAAGTHHRRRRVSGVRTTRRRRRVGAHEKLKDAVLLVVGAGLGGVVTPFIVQAVNTAASGITGMPAWMVPAGGVLTGAAVAGVGLAHKNYLAVGFGGGMAGVGAAMAANEMGLSEPGISGTAFSNNAAPGATAVTQSLGCRKVGSPQKFVNQTVGNVDRMQAMAIGALYSN